MTIVNLSREVSYQTLESALKDAAIKVGWEIEVKPSYEISYRLGSVEKVKRYRWADVKVSETRRNFLGIRKKFMKMAISIYDGGLDGNRRDHVDYFELDRKPLFSEGVSESEAERYLGAVSEELEKNESKVAQ